MTLPSRTGSAAVSAFGLEGKGGTRLGLRSQTPILAGADTIQGHAWTKQGGRKGPMTLIYRWEWGWKPLKGSVSKFPIVNVPGWTTRSPRILDIRDPKARTGGQRQEASGRVQPGQTALVTTLLDVSLLQCHHEFLPVGLLSMDCGHPTFTPALYCVPAWVWGGDRGGRSQSTQQLAY